MSSPSNTSFLVKNENSSSSLYHTPGFRLTPEKERKLQERFSKAPGSHTQVGFEVVNSTTDNTMSTSSSSLHANSWEETTRGRENSISRTAREESNQKDPTASNTSISEDSRRRGEGSRTIPEMLGKRLESPRLKRSKSQELSPLNNDRSNQETRQINGSGRSPSINDIRNESNDLIKLAPDETLKVADDTDMDDDQQVSSTSPDSLKEPVSLTDKTKKSRFTPEEDQCLLEKYAEFGPNWKLICQEGGEVLAGRTPNSLSRRHVTLTKRTSSSGPQSQKPLVSSSSITPDDEEQDDEVEILEVQTAPTSQNTIYQFFKPAAVTSSSNNAVSSTTQSCNTKRTSATTSTVIPVGQQAAAMAEIQRFTLELEKARREKHEAEILLENRTKEADRSLEEMRQRTARATELIISMLRAEDKAEAARLRKSCSEASFMLGRITVTRSGVGPHAHAREHWEDGQTKRDLALREAKLLQQKTELDRQQKQMKSKRRVAGSETHNQLEVELEERALEEVRAARLARLKMEEAQIMEDRARFQVEKALHMRELKRMRDEDSSKWLERPVLVNRYLLRSMLGKGGFSEVWKAFDLLEMRDVAIKIHELDPSWSEERRRNYSKHAKREYQIHLALRHPRIVQLYDVIEINQSSSFATVLEYCPGTDLDVYLKKHKYLPEKEAKSILMQVLSGLLCLSSGGGIKDSNSIIHYDIKPANILFDVDGSVKITDFGLSKIVTGAQDDTVPGIELTSQGAGTYWYLPPECFNFDRANPPKISNKVDVWSTGVVFYQMLFGQRPFGEGLSQESMLKAETVLRATKVEFPAKPVVSDGAKEFIRRCLTHSQHLRPDVETICQDPYLRSNKKRPASSISSSSMGAPTWTPGE